MLNFCTLFDSNYLSRGLALYESLKLVSPGFHLYVVAFNEECYRYLTTVPEKSLTVIRLTDFENEALLKVKPERTAAEYCWTCTPSIISYCIEQYRLDACIYVDADMIFYHDPRLLLDELKNDSVLITEHRFTKDYDVSATHGIYCVQFMFFKNDSHGLTALHWWRDRCLEWCHAYLEDGKFGDQKYLDDWTTRFEGVHVLKHPGGGLAPWNIQQFSLQNINGELFITDKKNGNVYPLVFYHFHGLKFFTDETVECCASLYELDTQVKEILYFPYIRDLLKLGKIIHQQTPGLNPHGGRQPSPSSGKTIFEYIRNTIFQIKEGKINIFKGRIFNFRLHKHLYKLIQFK
jgi:hypothetical protein